MVPFGLSSPPGPAATAPSRRAQQQPAPAQAQQPNARPAALPGGAVTGPAGADVGDPGGRQAELAGYFLRVVRLARPVEGGPGRSDDLLIRLLYCAKTLS